MENQDLLIQILELLKLDDVGFNSQLIHGIFIENVTYAILYTILFIALLVISYKINHSIKLNQIVSSVFSLMRGQKAKKTIQVDNIESITMEDVRNISDFIHYIRYIMFKNGLYGFGVYLVALFIILLELDFGFDFFYNLLSRIVTCVNCYVAPEKILMDYLGSLF